jgi:hypothetical protein
MPPFENDDVVTGLYGLSIGGDDDYAIPLTGVKVKV